MTILQSEEKLLELYQELHASDKPQLVNHLESVLEDMMNSMKRLQIENQRLELSWIKEREDHEKYLHKLEEEMDSQVQKVEETVKEQAREEVEAERKALKTQMDAEMDELQTHLKLFQKVDTWLKSNQDPETDSKVKVIRSKLEDAVQDNRQLRMNLMDTQTNIALMRSELSQLKTSYEEKCRELHEKRESDRIYARTRLSQSSTSTFTLRNKRGSIIGSYISDEVNNNSTSSLKSKRQLV
ncbi:Ras and EF-hand domain-containing [Nymphon striatum]|nr:Ras and EF-hand domain-containing [Nymphon striatum]